MRQWTIAWTPAASSIAVPGRGGWLPQLGNRGVGSNPLDQQFDFASRRFASAQPRIDDARVVEHQQIPGGHAPWQVGEAQIDQAVAVDVKQAAADTHAGRVLRDQLGRQRIIEIREGQRCHSAPTSATGYFGSNRSDAELMQ